MAPTPSIRTSCKPYFAHSLFRNYLKILSLCHTVIVEKNKEGGVTYNVSD